MAKFFKNALILAAGRGTRMAPLTDVIPKPMAPIRGSTLILDGILKILPVVEHVHITVGYKARALAEHVIEEGVNSVISTEGKGNAWWLFNTLLSNLDEPLLVLTCDNLTELEFGSVIADYHDLGCPANMVVPVNPVLGLDGDYIFHDQQKVTKLSRTEISDHYCSGIQVINPVKLRSLMDPVDDFGAVWDNLIAANQLYVSRVTPTRWFTIDTINALSEASAR